MNIVTKADIFFFVATIAVVVFLVLGSIALYYLIRSLRNLKNVTQSMNSAILNAENDIEVVKNSVVKSALFKFLFGKKKRSITKK